MTAFIQINIYNQTLDSLRSRGHDLQKILRIIGCTDVWISEIPIYATKQPTQSFAAESIDFNDNTPISTSKTLSLSFEESNRFSKTPFKSISAEIGDVHPLNLKEALEGTSSIVEAKPDVQGILNDWTADVPGTSSEFGTNELTIPNEEFGDITDDIGQQDLQEDTEMTQEQEINLFEEIIRQQTQSFRDTFEKKGKKKTANTSTDPSSGPYLITCKYPNCGLQYNWRVKYGKLRLLDHALTHSNRKIPCRICGAECPNVRRIRSHYAKAHPNHPVEGYGIKSLVSGEFGTVSADKASEYHVSEEELKALWDACYSDIRHLVGEATAFVDGDKYTRLTKRKKLERATIDSISQLLNS
ncbi:hypothetical protein L5515_004423 [Caenorhabditis briggsae]|uniref:Uncharacterized protein n=1 Tax=Caenorhabditis briggsae TaxID=6238 RepID=A0AAE9JB40_CAEBR|nr:hypothetical protein L5515_004423 [Caenorhabditis briggsae]